MTTRFLRKTLLAATFGIGLLLLLPVFLALWSAPAPRTLDLRIAGPTQITNGDLALTVVLSNRTPRSLNVVDDMAGNPWLILDAGTGYYPAGSGSHTVYLGSGGNTLKLNLAAGASLTNTVWITNAPARFRLQASVRDLAAERRHWWTGKVIHLLPQQWLEKLEERLTMSGPTSAWVQTEISKR